ncbi:hypothetical protein V6Z11_A11G161200 [Gossypium hirsutum]
MNSERCKGLPKITFFLVNNFQVVRMFRKNGKAKKINFFLHRNNCVSFNFIIIITFLLRMIRRLGNRNFGSHFIYLIFFLGRGTYHHQGNRCVTFNFIIKEIITTM